VLNYFDPSAGSKFLFVEGAASPAVTSATFMDEPGVAYFDVWAWNGSSFSAPQVVSGNTSAIFADGTTAFEYEGFSSTGAPISLPDGYVFGAAFTSAVQANAVVLNIQGNASFSGQGVTGPANVENTDTLVVSSGSFVSGIAIASGGSIAVMAGGSATDS